MKPTKTNAVLVCDKCANIFREWSDTCRKCKHELVNVCVTYKEAQTLSRKIRPKPQSTYRTRRPRRDSEAREVGPKVITPPEHQEP